MSLPVEVTPAVLAAHPLPDHDDGASKHDRGSVLVIGGSAETPGAALLAGLAALRAGAGRLCIATDAAVATAVGVAVPEARVTALDERVVALAADADAVLFGPGMLDGAVVGPTLDAVTSAMAGGDGLLALDARALPVVADRPDWVRRMGGRVLLTPNPSELGDLGADDAATAAARFGAVVAARGASTVIASPAGDTWIDHHGTVGLATSGSGDVAAGLALGFLGRGADPVTAALWAAAVHGLAGERLGPPGFLARELLDAVPAVLASLGARG